MRYSDLTPETIQRTRESFAINCENCITEAVSGKQFVNDIESYIIRNTESAQDYRDGKHDHILAFLQRAIYIQTGECHPILPKRDNKVVKNETL